MSISNYVARVVSINLLDKKGDIADIIFVFKRHDDYLKANAVYFGVMIGMVAACIKSGTVNLNVLF